MALLPESGVSTITACQEKFLCLWPMLINCKCCEFYSYVLIHCYPILCVTWHMIIESSDLSKNNLTGDVPINGSFSYFTPIRFVQFNFVCFHKHTERITLQRLANSHFGSVESHHFLCNTLLLLSLLVYYIYIY